MGKADWLYLFTSNASPQYAQDLLNVFAGVPGHPYVFRYEAQWVEEATRAAWDEIRADRNSVLLCFSLQQPAQLQDPAFIPVRTGRVMSTKSIGSHYFVTFELGPYVSLPKPDSENDEDYAELVKRFTQRIKDHCTTPYSASCSLGTQITKGAPAPDWVDFAESQPLLFERTTRFLSRAEPFRDTRFFRFEGLRTLEATPGEIELSGDSPAFTLEAGKSYRLSLLQNQPGLITDKTRFTVSTDGAIVQVIGQPWFDIASGYDQVEIEIHASPSKEFETRDTVIIVEAAPGGSGPWLEIPIRVVTSFKKTAGVASLTVAGLVLIGVTAAFPTLESGWKIAMVGVGAALASYMQTLGFSLPTPPSF